ncbi:MAG: SdiA-regulated domain-containing protein [Bacteroidota bacterium]
MPFSLLVVLAVLLAACTPSEDLPGASASAPRPDGSTLLGTVPYDLAQPDARFALEPRLREISGLAWLDSGRLVAVQDEDGDLFELDPETGGVLRVTRFYNSGDYEGVALADDVLWVVESDGDLYRYDGTDEAEKIDPGLKRSNDVEGLAYDAAQNRLLLALKGDPGNDLEDVRAIYAFDLASGRLFPEPAYTLDRERLDSGADSFKPSGLAIHPETDEIYIISADLRALIVLIPEGELQAAVALPVRLYPQPEGIAFAPDGTLFLSNEGGSGAATLLRFSPQPSP